MQSYSPYMGAVDQRTLFQHVRFAIKRKDDPVSETDVTDLMREVSLSPQKKARIQQAEDQDVAISEGSMIEVPAFDNDGKATEEDPGVSREQSPPKEETQEKALVLYRPVSPTLFPGGPLLGSPPLPLLAVKGGAGGNPIRGLGPLEALVSGKPSSLAVGPIFMKSLDLSGMLEHAPATELPRRLHRANSCSSIPCWNGPVKDRSGEDEPLEDLEMEDEQDAPSASLAVVPWMPTPSLPPDSTVFQPTGVTVQSVPSSLTPHPGQIAPYRGAAVPASPIGCPSFARSPHPGDARAFALPAGTPPWPVAAQAHLLAQQHYPF